MLIDILYSISPLLNQSVIINPLYFHSHLNKSIIKSFLSEECIPFTKLYEVINAKGFDSSIAILNPFKYISLKALYEIIELLFFL